MSDKYKLPPWSFREHGAIRKDRDPINALVALVAAMGHEPTSVAVAEAAINAILEADRAARPFAPDPRMVEIQRAMRAHLDAIGAQDGQKISSTQREIFGMLENLAADPDMIAPPPDPRLVEIQENERNYSRAACQYRVLENQARIMNGAEYENALLGAGQRLKDAHNVRGALLRSIAAAPDVTAPPPDPRIAQLAELQRRTIALFDRVSAVKSNIGEINEFYLALQANLALVHLDEELDRLASAPTIDPCSPPPQAAPRAASEARRKEIQDLAAVEAGFSRMVHAIDQIGIEPPAEVSSAVETLAAFLGYVWNLSLRNSK